MLRMHGRKYVANATSKTKLRNKHGGLCYTIKAVIVSVVLRYVG